jgi:hypothetical protein
MFAAEITNWLNANTTASSKAYVVAHLAETRDILDRLGITRESELAYFYSHFDASAVRGWYELNEIDQVHDATDYARTELKVPADYIALTGIEGQGIVLYNRNTQAVYDLEFGQFDQLADGTLAPIASSFQGFLQWCKAEAGAP